MITMAVIVFLTLATIAAAHVAWGFGANWPAANRDDLFHLVVGATRQSEMPTLPQCLAAAAAIFLAGFSALLVADIVKLPLPPSIVTVLGVLVALVFAGRGIAPYTPVWRQRFSKQPFAAMDQSWYGPLCLLLAICFVILLLKRVMS
jgi:hypothetical protein